MDRPGWTTPDGRVLYKAEVSRHHVAFERRAYKTRLESLYRNMGGMVLLLGSQAHGDLHAEVPPPPKPNHNLMTDIYQHARLMGYDTQYDVFEQIVDYVARVAVGFQCDENVHDANLLYQNLAQQAVFIEQGRLTPIERIAA